MLSKEQHLCLLIMKYSTAYGGFRMVGLGICCWGYAYFVLQLLEEIFPFVLNGLHCKLGCLPCRELCAMQRSFTLAFSWNTMIELQGLLTDCFDFIKRLQELHFRMFHICKCRSNCHAYFEEYNQNS